MIPNLRPGSCFNSRFTLAAHAGARGVPVNLPVRPPRQAAGQMEAVMLKAFLKDESGSTAVEYGLIALFVMLGIVVNASLISDSLSRIFAETHSGLMQ